MTSVDLVVRYFREVWERGDVALLDELLAADFVDHDAPPGYPPDRAGHVRLAADMVAMMADRRYTLHAVEADGDCVTVRYAARWRQVGDFFGRPLDGQHLALHGTDRYRVQGGRIAESWHTQELRD
jgi:ketosteroid isomerase-like protein